MKYSVGDSIKSLVTGQIGKIVGTDYSFRVKNGNATEVIKYQVIFEGKESVNTVNEDILEHAVRQPEVSPFAEEFTLRLLIDGSIDRKDEFEFMRLTDLLNRLKGVEKV